VINLQEEDADDYTCVAVNAGGVSEQNVSLTFDTPALEPNREEPPERDRHFSTLIAAVVGGKGGGVKEIGGDQRVKLVDKESTHYTVYSGRTKYSARPYRRQYL
jgi:hypothetical protein